MLKLFLESKDNADLLRSWVKMGLEVRHFKDWGYHLTVIDGKEAILSTNNPKNTEERTSMVIYNAALANALRHYFYSLWDKALPINS
jgi:hypothetical protein